VASWIRRSFDSPGLTQVPPGRHLATLQRRYPVGGVVMLCIDVSYSRGGAPLREAVRGARAFVQEAVEAHYKVGVLLWADKTVDMSGPSTEEAPALRLLEAARVQGGTSLLEPLEQAHGVLDRFRAEPDRVVAIFGDGDLGPRDSVLSKVRRMKAEGIRFVTRGLGGSAAREYEEVSSEPDERVEVGSVDDLADSIAAMATSLKGPGQRKRKDSRREN
jgi:uncharacterized protein (DUF58 family)